MSYAERLYKAITLNIEFYESVEADKSLTRQAMMTVALVATLEGFIQAGIAPIALAQGVLGSILRWLLWAFFIAFVGTRILPEPETNSNTGELLRTLGFAYAPGLLAIFVFLPVVGFLFSPNFFLIYLLELMAMTVAVRQALDFSSTVRAVGVCIVAFIMMIITLGLLIFFSDFVYTVAMNASPVAVPLNPEMGV